MASAKPVPKPRVSLVRARASTQPQTHSNSNFDSQLYSSVTENIKSSLPPPPNFLPPPIPKKELANSVTAPPLPDKGPPLSSEKGPPPIPQRVSSFKSPVPRAPPPPLPSHIRERVSSVSEEVEEFHDALDEPEDPFGVRNGLLPPLIPCPEDNEPMSRDSWPFAAIETIIPPPSGNLLTFDSVEPEIDIANLRVRPSMTETEKSLSITDLPCDPSDPSDPYQSDIDSIPDSPSLQDTSAATDKSLDDYYQGQNSPLATPTGHSICFGGWVRVESLTGPKTLLKANDLYWCRLRDSALVFYKSDTNLDSSKFKIKCGDILFVGKRPNSDPGAVFLHMALKYSEAVVQLLKFQIEEVSELDTWVMLLSKVIAPIDVTELTQGCDRAGRIMIQEGSCNPEKAYKGWICMTGKTLSYVSEAQSELFEIDLRKLLGVKDKSSGIVLQQIGTSLTLSSKFPIAISFWKRALQTSLLNVGHELESQRLTAENVPILVDRCIDFVATHGLREKGVYRLAGHETKIKKLLNHFATDPMDVVLRIDDYNVHDVASCMKRFFRSLETPLFPKEMRTTVISAIDETDISKKHMLLRSCLSRLSPVRYACVRKLLDHLCDVAANSGSNSMTTPTLATVFGPSVFSTDALQNGNNPAAQMVDEIGAMHELMVHSKSILWSEDELARKEEVSSKMEKLRKYPSEKKPAGDLLSPIHLFEKENQAFNVSVKMTSKEICEFAAQHKKLDDKYNYVLMECVRDGQLQRLVFAEETLLDICVKRWQKWSSSEVSSCYFVLKQDFIRPKLQFAEPYPFCEVYLANPGSKKFVKNYVACQNGSVHIYKDNSMKKCLKSWRVEELLWYLGREDKRTAPFQHNLTMLPVDQIPVKGEYLGYCFSMHTESQLYNWFRAVFNVQRPLFRETST